MPAGIPTNLSTCVCRTPPCGSGFTTHACALCGQAVDPGGRLQHDGAAALARRAQGSDHGLRLCRNHVLRQPESVRYSTAQLSPRHRWLSECWLLPSAGLEASATGLTPARATSTTPQSCRMASTSPSAPRTTVRARHLRVSKLLLLSAVHDPVEYDMVSAGLWSLQVRAGR